MPGCGPGIQRPGGWFGLFCDAWPPGPGMRACTCIYGGHAAAGPQACAARAAAGPRPRPFCGAAQGAPRAVAGGPAPQCWPRPVFRYTLNSNITSRINYVEKKKPLPTTKPYNIIDPITKGLKSNSTSSLAPDFLLLGALQGGLCWAPRAPCITYEDTQK